MSQENVETVRRAYLAWNADELDAFLAELDPECEWHPSIEPALEGKGTTYRGLDEVRTAWDDYRGGAWERLTVTRRRFAISAGRFWSSGISTCSTGRLGLSSARKSDS